MSPAVYETTSVKIGGGGYRFTVAASSVKFDGYQAVYVPADEDKAENSVMAGSISEDTPLALAKL